MSSTPSTPSPEFTGVLRVDVDVGEPSQNVLDGIPLCPDSDESVEFISGGEEDEIPFPWEPSVAYPRLFHNCYNRHIDVVIPCIIENII